MKLFSIIILFVFSSINAFATETTGVISTIQPINSLVSAVIGNTGKTISIIPAEQSPHDFKLKPSDVKVLQNGNIIFYVSNHLESSVTKVFKNLPKNIKLINLMKESGINHLAIRDNAAWERHDHHGDDGLVKDIDVMRAVLPLVIVHIHPEDFVERRQALDDQPHLMVHGSVVCLAGDDPATHAKYCAH